MLDKYRGLISEQWINIDKQLKLQEDFFCLQRFHNIFQAFKVFGCYALASALIVPLVNVLMIPLMSMCLVAGAVYCLKSFDKTEDEAKKLIKTGLTTLGVGLYLPIAGLSIHFLMASVFLWRAYKTLDHWAKGKTLGDYVLGFGQDLKAECSSLHQELRSAFTHS